MNKTYRFSKSLYGQDAVKRALFDLMTEYTFELSEEVESYILTFDNEKKLPTYNDIHKRLNEHQIRNDLEVMYAPIRNALIEKAISSSYNHSLDNDK